MTTVRRSLSMALSVGALLLSGVPPAPPPRGATPVQSAEAQRVRAAGALAKLPLAFEPNRGQSPGDVTYLTRAPGWLLHLTATGMRVMVDGHALRWTWQDARSDAAVAGEAELPGKVNYLKGNDPALWRTDIPTYSRVRYSAIYPGVDLVYYGNGRQLEYDLVVAPHADPAAARLVLEGTAAAITGNGDVDVSVNDRAVLRMGAPVAYQERHGERMPVHASYRLSATATGSELSFDVGPYDRDLPLIIDPLVYSTFLGGNDLDGGQAIVVNDVGEAFVTGSTGSVGVAPSGFPTTSGAFDVGSNGASDVFVTRLNSTGTALVYSTFLGGLSHEVGVGLAINGANEVFVTGTTGSMDFPLTAAAFDILNGGNADVFITRLNSSGTALIYSTFLGGNDDEIGESIAVNAANEAFVAGSTTGVTLTFPTTPGAFDTDHNGNRDAFVARLNNSGTALIYSTLLGGRGYDKAYGIAVNAADEAFVTGEASYGALVVDFPTTAGAFDSTHNGETDVFVTHLNSTGTGLVYSTFLGGNGVDQGFGIALNAANEAFVTGYCSLGFPTTPGAFDVSFNGAADAFVARLNATGSGLVYSTFLGGSYVDYAKAIAVNAAGEAFVTGRALDGDVDFPTTGGAFDTTHNGTGWNTFVSRVNGPGTVLVYSTFLSGTGDSIGEGIAVDAANDAFVTGETVHSAIGFPTTVGAFDTSFNGGVLDAFVARVSTDPPPAPHPPTNFRVTGMAGNIVTFGWIPPVTGTTPSGFQIEGGLGPGQVLAALHLGPVPTLTLAMPTGSFYMRVRSLGSAGASTPSNEVLVHVNASLPPSVPANLLGLAVGSTLDLAWTNTFSGGVPTGLVLDVTGTLSGSLPLGVVDSLSFAGVPPGTYTMSLRAVNGTGSSPASNAVTLTFPHACSGVPQPVTNFVAYKTGTTLFLAWEPGTSGAAPTSYLVHVTGAFVGSVPFGQRTLSAAVPPGTYAFAIAARNACGSSSPTAIQAVTIP
jgi:hypothetical protein